MAVVRTQIVVAKCVDCPFFERGAISVLGDLFTKRAEPEHARIRSGSCKYHGLGHEFPLGRVRVPNQDVIPDTCPLQSGDCLVQLRRPS